MGDKIESMDDLEEGNRISRDGEYVLAVTRVHSNHIEAKCLSTGSMLTPSRFAIEKAYYMVN